MVQYSIADATNKYRFRYVLSSIHSLSEHGTILVKRIFGFILLSLLFSVSIPIRFFEIYTHFVHTGLFFCGVKCMVYYVCVFFGGLH